MKQNYLVNQRKALVVICITVLILAQQALTGPLVLQVQSSSDQRANSRGERTVHTLRRVARMTPLWRIMSSKPSGAFCQNDFECVTGLCKQGYCSVKQRSPSEPMKY
nr:liver-expressed antimicrobial peptide 2 [Nothobranchius furzeri]